MVEAYEAFGCNNADLFVIAVDYNDTDAECIAFDETYGIEFPTISGIEGGGNAILSTYGIQYAPTYILIAPNHDIVIPVIWPVPNAQTFIDAFEGQGVEQAECGSITANFSSDVMELCGSGTVQFSDMSIGDITTWEWTFEGGDPETSTEQNPVVTYNNVGSWDVTLTVNGDDGATFMIEDYMSIYEIPDVSLEPLDVACVFWAPYELTGGLPEGGEYSGPGVSEGMFDPEAADLGTHTITYTYISDDGCENSAEETLIVDACTGIDEVKESEVKVYPNPTNDVVYITSKSDMVSVNIYSYTGQMIENVQLNGKEYQFNATSYPAGVYSIKIETKESIISKRLIIQ